jgi:hypothetical protein
MELAIAAGLSGLNVLLLSILTIIWLRNYMTFQTPLILGLIVFAVVMLIENGVAIYFFVGTDMLYKADPHVHTLVAGLRGLQFFAVAVLTYVTWK